MFRLKIKVMAIFTEIYSFRLDVVQGHIYNQNMCFLDWVCRLISKYKLLVSFKAATPCCINKCL